MHTNFSGLNWTDRYTHFYFHKRGQFYAKELRSIPMTPLTTRMFVYITEVQKKNRQEEPCVEESEGEHYDDHFLRVLH